MDAQRPRVANQAVTDALPLAPAFERAVA
ncbi:MAG: hypothetical protein RIT40_142, partial [Planctomycetota bacterium]